MNILVEKRMLVPILILDSNKEIIVANNEFLAISGFRSENLIGKNLVNDKLYISEYLENIFCIVDKLNIWQGEMQINNKEDMIWHNLNITKNEDKGYTITAFDITEKKIYQDELIIAEQKFKHLFETSSDALIMAKDENIISKVNKATLTLFGYNKEEMLGKKVEEFLTREYEDLEHKLEEMIAITKNGERIPIEVTFSVWKLKEEQYFSYFIRDISDRKRIEKERLKAFEKAKASNEDLQNFAYIASHDLREPLRMVESYLKLIERRYKDMLDESGREFINYAVDGAKRMKNLINGLLELSRITTRGKKFSNISMEEVLLDVEKNLETKIKEYNVNIAKDNLPDITGDYYQLISLFQNIIDNGIKYNENENINIKVKHSEDEDYHIFEIIDNGIGIRERDKKSIFMMFKRLHAKGEFSGSGVGLAHVKKIVQRHNGVINVESEFGKGTNFTVKIPKLQEVYDEI